MTTTPYVRPNSPRARRGGLADDIASYVRGLILTGGLKPGEKIDQDAIGAALDVSRSPIREALVVLGQEGLLELTPRRGAFVANLTREDIIEHYELFGLVAGRVAAMAANALSADELDELASIHGRFVNAAPEDQPKLNDEFHRLINSVAPRRTRWLLRHLDRSIPEDYYDFALGWAEKAVAGHEAITAAIVDRNPNAARQAMEAHLHESGVAAADSLLSRGFWEDTE